MLFSFNSFQFSVPVWFAFSLFIYLYLFVLSIYAYTVTNICWHEGARSNHAHLSRINWEDNVRISWPHMRRLKSKACYMARGMVPWHLMQPLKMREGKENYRCILHLFMALDYLTRPQTVRYNNIDSCRSYQWKGQWRLQELLLLETEVEGGFLTRPCTRMWPPVFPRALLIVFKENRNLGGNFSIYFFCF